MADAIFREALDGSLAVKHALEAELARLELQVQAQEASLLAEPANIVVGFAGFGRSKKPAGAAAAGAAGGERVVAAERIFSRTSVGAPAVSTGAPSGASGAKGQATGPGEARR